MNVTRNRNAIGAGLLVALMLTLLVIGGLLILAWPTHAAPIAGALVPVALTPEPDPVPASLLRGHN